MNARSAAATTPTSMIEPGSPEEAYQAINRAKMLWGFRRRDVDSWKDVIDRWAIEPKAWKRIPEVKPYGTARKMIEAEVCESYDAFVSFVADIVGNDYAAKLRDDLGERGAPEGTVNNPNGSNQYRKPKDNYDTHNNYPKQYDTGTSTAYLEKRLKRDRPEVLSEIGKGKKYKTVNEAATAVGIVRKRDRLCFYADDPTAAARYLLGRVDAGWIATFVAELVKG